jgi:arylsulfatase
MPQERPNIVLFITEHWRGDSLSSLGHPVAETPHIDELSAQGVTFTSAFSPCPSCIAARRSIFSGQTPNTHGMVGYCDDKPWPYQRTLAGELARSGYQTINVGKTHFHPQRLHLGFEELIVPQDYAEWIDAKTGMTRANFAHGIHGNSWMARASHLPENDMEETWFTDQAIKRIEKRDPERPFFLTLSYNGVHPPLCPPQTYFDMFMAKDIPGPVVGEWARELEPELPSPPPVNAWRAKLSPELIKRARAAYYAYMAYVDAQIGRFIEFLGRSWLANDTLFLFTADHGEMLGDHHHWRKTYAWDPSARIPFIVRPPLGWKAQRNARSNALIGLEDIMPTLLTAADVEIPETVEGRSVMSLVEGEDIPWRDYYHHEHSPCYTKDNAYQCLTGKDWKYIWNPITGAEQLFNRKDDPDESRDLARDAGHSATLESWRAKLAGHLAGRPEGLSDGEKLTPGAVPVWRDPRG